MTFRFTGLSGRSKPRSASAVGGQRVRTSGADRRRATRRLLCETLEDRRLLSVSYPDFGNSTGLNLLGPAAVTSDNVLRLTPAEQGPTSGAWFIEPQFVSVKFETTFEFRMSEGSDGGDGTDGSDGLAFVIQNNSVDALGAGAGGIGYHGMPNSLAVEFDTWLNNGPGDPFNDPSKSHISVHTGGLGANSANEAYSLGAYDTLGKAGFILDDAQIHTATINYVPGTLTVSLDDLGQVLSVSVDLAEILNLDMGRAWVGFVGSTGGGWQNHDILSWNYDVLVDTSTTVAVSDSAVMEGDSGAQGMVFTVTRSGDTTGTTTVNWATADGTANAASDYAMAFGQVTFNAGEATKTIVVTLNGDGAIEPHETFKVLLSGATGGVVADGVGIGTILTDEVAISIGRDTATEGDATIRPLGAHVSAGLGGLNDPYAMIIGPDGNLYVSTNAGSGVYRYDLVTGIPLPAPGKTGAEFVSPGDGGLNRARDITFGPGGFLYVVSENTHAVLRYDPITGAPAGLSGQLGDAVFIASGAGGLGFPRGIVFRDDHVYVTSVGGATPDSVLRYDAITGAPAGLSGQFGDAAFISSGSGGLDNPSRMVFGPDGRAYVSSTATTADSATSNSILRYDFSTGAPAGVSGQPGDAIFVSPGSGGLDGPVAMVFRPDGLYVTGWRSNSVNRYHTSTGVFVGQVVSPGSGGLSFAGDLLFDSYGSLLITSKDTNQVLRYGAASQFAFTVSLSSVSAAQITVQYATTDVSAQAGSDYVGVSSGTLTFVPGETAKTIIIKTVDNTSIELAENFNINLSNPTRGTVSSGQGVGTILDNDTKFYVVNDASPDTTLEYGSDGVSGESYSLGTGNTAPRGAASTIAGDKVWVVDANRKVYVYNTSGGLLGSWSLGSLSPSADVQGIATNGTDVWVVDSKSDKVFNYAGAATRISGSQNAASSFSLNSGNTSPKDIVTNGVNLWVVNDSTTDKVFKYTTAGALVSSWTITTPIATSPTGITIDPANVSNIWIVDRGTDRVYQYNSSASLPTGSSKSADVSFALAASNTNPQGIADPPAPSAEWLVASVVGPQDEAAESPLAAIWDAAPVTHASLGSHTASRTSVAPRVAAASSVDEVLNRWGSLAEPIRTMSIGDHQTIATSRRPRHTLDANQLGDELDGILSLIADELVTARR